MSKKTKVPILLELKDLDLTLTIAAEKRLKQLRKKLEVLKSDFEELSTQDNDADNQIPVGSRVSISYDDGTKGEGRIWYPNHYGKGYGINRDGYSSYMYFPASAVKNTSIGTLGNLEREIWLTKVRIANYEEVLDGTGIPECLKEREKNIVQVVDVKRVFPCEIIEFVVSHNLYSGSLKIPAGKVFVPGFYEIVISEEKIVAINKSSELAFNLSYKG